MDYVCDFCGQFRTGVIFEGRNEKGEREERHICFDCIDKYVQFESDNNRVLVDEDGAELPTQRGD